jgi:hypothetical protein
MIREGKSARLIRRRWYTTLFSANTLAKFTGVNVPGAFIQPGLSGEANFEQDMLNIKQHRKKL